MYQVTGDTSGRSQNVLGKVGTTIWDKVVRTFGISLNQLHLNATNPTHQEARVLCNAMFSNYDEILIHPKNKELIRDCEFVKAKADGHRMKDNRSDVTQQSDLLDAMIYDLNMWNRDFIIR